MPTMVDVKTHDDLLQDMYSSCPGREYDGLQMRVPTGAGKGFRFATPRKPVPVTRVEGLVTCCDGRYVGINIL